MCIYIYSVCGVCVYSVWSTVVCVCIYIVCVEYVCIVYGVL